MKPLKKILFPNNKLDKSSELFLKLKADFSYHSSSIEGSNVSEKDNENIIKLSLNTKIESIATKYIGIYEHDEVIENFNCGNLYEYILETIDQELNEKELKIWHNILKKGTEWSKRYTKSYGDYKKQPNKIGNDIPTPQPWQVPELMQKLILTSNEIKTINDITKFHAQFETIHPFLDGNGRIGRGIMFKQCIQNNLFPIIINNVSKKFYYDGLLHFQQTGKIDLLSSFFKEQGRFFEKKYEKYLCE